MLLDRVLLQEGGTSHLLTWGWKFVTSATFSFLEDVLLNFWDTRLQAAMIP